MEIKLKTINIEDKEKLLEMLKEYEESELIPNIEVILWIAVVFNCR